MSVFLQLMKGELDDSIEWPFDKLVTLVIIHQDNENKCFEASFEIAPKTKAEAFQKPVTDYNEVRGFRKFIVLEELHNEGFTKNDTLYIRYVIG